jgi:hypothetical protein
MEDDAPDERGGSVSLPGDSPVTTAVLELDRVYEALAHSRRRYLCYSLLADPEWTAIDLAGKIAAWEHGIAESDVTTEQAERVYVTLLHTHVPKLVEEGIVSFDPDTDRISAAENADQVLAALRGVGASLDARQKAHARSGMDAEEH